MFTLHMDIDVAVKPLSMLTIYGYGYDNPSKTLQSIVIYYVIIIFIRIIKSALIVNS